MVGLNQIKASILGLIILSVFGYVYMYLQDTTLDMKSDLSYTYLNASNTSQTLTGTPTDVTSNEGSIAKLVFVLGALGIAIAMVFSFMKK